MSIRIRVYPQPWSIGARRNRAIRRQQQLLNQQIAYQNQLIRQQSMFGYGTGFQSSFGSNYGTGSYSPSYGSSWGYANRFPSYYGSYGQAFSGAYALPGYGSYSSYYSPVSVAQYGAGY